MTAVSRKISQVVSSVVLSSSFPHPPGLYRPSRIGLDGSQEKPKDTQGQAAPPPKILVPVLSMSEDEEELQDRQFSERLLALQQVKGILSEVLVGKGVSRRLGESTGHFSRRVTWSSLFSTVCCPVLNN